MHPLMNSAFMFQDVFSWMCRKRAKGGGDDGEEDE
jgi:hypothetical protein